MSNDASTISLEQVLISWEKNEMKVEEKLDLLERAILQHLNLDHTIDYYENKGKFLERFGAGFVHGYFNILQDVSFLLLDPIHIFDLLTTLIGNLLAHPFQTIKAMWHTWTYYYTHGAFGLGMMMAEIVLGCIIVAVGGLLAGEKLVSLLKTTAKTFSSGIAGNITYIPEKLAGIAKKMASSVSLSKSIVKEAIKSPKALLADAIKSVDASETFGKFRDYKVCVQDYLGKSA